MKNSLRLTIIATVSLGSALSLSACAGGVSTNQSLNSINQPVVSRQNFAFDLATSQGSLPISEQRRLVDWFNALELGYGDQVTVDDPSGNRVALSMIEAIAARYGMLVDTNAPVTPGYVAPGSVRVVVTRSIASVPGCPDWSAKAEANPHNATHTNFGCAVNTNLARMVSDPEDLVRGQRSDNTSDTNRSSKAVDAWKTGEATIGLKGGNE